MIQQSDSIVDNVRSPQPMIVCLCYHSSVIAIKFANDDKGRLACASRDGTLSVFNVSTEPPSLLATLSGHRRPVNDFDWSVANEVLVSVSSDGTARLWDSTTGSCLREISDGNSGRALCCRFHPNNNNLVAVSNIVYSNVLYMCCKLSTL
jgi:WD40 repeat protein